MELWLKTCLLLCCYGFFKEVRPSEPFQTEYLLGPPNNFTERQVYYKIYPVWTYSYLSLLVVVFLVTDLLRYKPVIVFEGIGYVATWFLLLWARGVHWMQFMEFVFGIATSTEVAYYTYIYAKVDSCHYQKVTSYTRSAILSGRFLSGFLAQLLTSTGVLNYHTLNYVSLASVTFALVISMQLPSVKTSIYFHREATVGYTITEGTEDEDCVSESTTTNRANHDSLLAKDKRRTTVQQVCKMFRKEFKAAYSNKYLLKWSIWIAFATAINFQVGNYIQPLWESILSFRNDGNLLNGAVEATLTLLAAIAAFSVGYVHLNWRMIAQLVLAVTSLLDAILLVFMGITSQIWVGYVNYIVYRVLYHVRITIASYQVAKELKSESYGLVFGINMFFALLIQSILTFVVQWLEIEPGLQFVIYGCYFGILSSAFFAFFFYELSMEGILRQGLWTTNTYSQVPDETPAGPPDSC